MEGNYDNPHSREKWVVEMKISEYKKAIANLGKREDMQTIRISTHDKGIGKAMLSGAYVDLSNEPHVFAGIKQSLEKMLAIQCEILDSISADC